MKTHTAESLFVRLSPVVHAPEQLRRITEKGVDSDVVLDVSDLGFATSTLITELLEVRASIVSRGHRLVICCNDKVVRGIFNICGLHKVFTMADSQADALNALGMVDQTQDCK